MSRWLQILIFTVIIGLAKAHHFIRLVVLAALGLAGLWMVHILAQDYDKISHDLEHNLGKWGQQITHMIGQASTGETKLFKRSVDENLPEINWDLVLSRDPVSCARSFICQLAATEESNLNQEEKNILFMSRYSAEKATWASKQLKKALENGKEVKSPVQCMKMYKYCPYSSQTMMQLVKLFGR